MDTIEAHGRQSAASEGDDKYLTGDGDKVNSDEIPVSVQAFKDVESIVETAVALQILDFCQCSITRGDLLELIEELHPYVSIEDHCFQCLLLGICRVSEDLVSREIQSQSHRQLVNGLSDNHFPHVQSDQRCRLWLRQPIENLRIRRIGGECESSKRVHDKIDPEQLNWRENRLLLVAGDGRYKCKRNSSNVDRELEL